MLGSAVLEAAVGLVVVYWVASTLCSAARELVARVFSQRERMLEEAVYRMLGADTGKKPEAGTAFAARVLANPLVRNLGRDADSPPSYVPARTFALAMLHELGVGADGKSLDGVRATVATLPPPVQRVLTPLVNSAAGDVDKLRAALEQHFDHAMDRATGWYKRNTQTIVLGFAAALALLGNVDTCHVARALYRSPTERARIVAVAGEQATRPPPEESSGAQLDALTRSDWDAVLDLPLGWTEGARPAWLGALREGHARFWSRRVMVPLLWWLLGCLLTAAAVTLGAPFWFDLLTQLTRVNLRSSGPPPRSSS
jgi:hypothetical protein